MHTLYLWFCDGVTDVSGLAGCAALHTLVLSGCKGVRDLSALAGCATLHTLELSCAEVSDLSPLASCGALHTLRLSSCVHLTNASRNPGGLRRVAHARVQELSVADERIGNGGLPNVAHAQIRSCQALTDVSALAGCATLHTLELSNMYTGETDWSALDSIPSVIVS